jgi:hypothetical protein
MSPQRSKTERNRRKKENAKKRKADAKSKETEEKELLEKLSKISIPRKIELEAAQPSDTPVNGSILTSVAVEAEGEQYPIEESSD